MVRDGQTDGPTDNATYRATIAAKNQKNDFDSPDF